MTNSSSRPACLCPSREVLAAFLHEQLPQPVRQEVASHISSCPECSSAISKLDEAGDTPLRGLLNEIAAEDHGPVPSDSAPRMIAGLQALPEGLGADELRPPERLGQYRLFDRIGRGGMGVVFRAQHVHLKKWVAVKLLPPGRLTDGRAVARFEREMEVIGRLDHPNIVRATDAGTADGFHYLAMELLDGEDLGRLVRRRGALPIADACELIRQAAVGLQHAHEHGLVHRDLKPNNLMLTARGEVKVLDLGLALLRGEPTAEALSATGQVMGTADYMAPEQWEASHEVDIRADIYSLGCTISVLLTGSPPFPSSAFDSVYKKLKAHHEAPVPSLAQRRPGLPVELDRLVRRMLEKDPARRPQTPLDVVRGIAPFCNGAELPRLLAESTEILLNPSGPPPAGVETKTIHDSSTGAYSGSTRSAVSSRSRIRARVLGVCLAVALLGFGAWLVSKYAFGSRPDPTAVRNPAPVPDAARPGNVPGPRVFKPGEWADLLDRPPVQLQWPKGKVDSHWNFDADDRCIRIAQCQGLGILELATVAGPGFDLELTLSQRPWVGGIGIFFRGRDEPIDRATTTWADYLVIGREAGMPPPDHDRLTRGLLQQVSGAENRFLFPRKNDPIPRLGAAAEHTVRIEVGELGLKGVWWDGERAGLALLDPVAEIPNREGAEGAVGILVDGSPAVFRAARLRLHPHEKHP